MSRTPFVVPRRLLAALASLLALAALTGPAAAATSPVVSLVPVARFTQPVGVVAAPGDTSRLFIVEEDGTIVERRGATQSTFADLTDRVKSDGGEQGLLGLAFAPDYQTSGRLYVYYTTPAPAGTAVYGGADIVVSEFHRADADHVDPSSERVILRIPHRRDQYENGGQLRFGPDGKLWIGTGDGGGEYDLFGNAQRLDPATDDASTGADALLGKLLRIDPTPGDGCGGQCTIPADNPGFPQREVWAYGLRNPWRFAFDRVTGDLALTDVGNATQEELDYLPAPDRGKGSDLGWPIFEGTARTSSTQRPGGPCCTGPALTRTHAAPDGYTAMIGGVFVHDPGLPALAGRFLYADLGSGLIQAVRLGSNSAFDDRSTGLSVPLLTSFGEDGCGRVYVTALSGALYRLSQGEGACDAVGVTLTAPARERTLKTARVTASLTCATACTATASASLRSGAAVLGRTASRKVTLKAGAKVTLALTPSAKTRAAARRAIARGRKPAATVVVVAHAADGGAQRRATVTTRVTA